MYIYSIFLTNPTLIVSPRLLTHVGPPGCIYTLCRGLYSCPASFVDLEASAIALACPLRTPVPKMTGYFQSVSSTHLIC